MKKARYGHAYSDGVQRTIKFLLSRGVPHDSAPDIAQSAWMRGWERLDQLRDESMLLAWINTIALNLFRRMLRGSKHEEALQPAHYDLHATVQNWAAIDLSRILDGCYPKERGLLEAQLTGITARELAEQEGVTPTAIRIRLLRARRSARQICQPSVPIMRAA
jgi:RNA polymerase sigma factor (sigma-70 family)